MALRQAGRGLSIGAQVVAAAENDPANKALDSARGIAPARLFAAAKLYGNLNDPATGLGQLTAQGGLDVFQAAAKLNYPAGKNPFNNWLTAESKPSFDVYPEAIGVYLSGFGDETDGLVQALVENVMLDLSIENSSLVIQNLLTVPSGFGIVRRASTTKANTTVVSEQFGDVTPHALFRLPAKTKFPRDRQLKAILTGFSPQFAAYIAGLAGTFPACGGTIGIVILGQMSQRVAAQR